MIIGEYKDDRPPTADATGPHFAEEAAARWSALVPLTACIAGLVLGDCPLTAAALLLVWAARAGAAMELARRGDTTTAPFPVRVVVWVFTGA